MNEKLQQKYIAFMEGVCAEFNCPQALPALQMGFKALCEGTGESQSVNIPNGSLMMSAYRNAPHGQSGLEYLNHKSDALNNFYQRDRFGSPTNFRPHNDLFKAIKDELEQAMSQRPFDADFAITDSRDYNDDNGEIFGTLHAKLATPVNMGFEVRKCPADENGNVSGFEIVGGIGKSNHFTFSLYTGSDIHEAVQAIIKFYRQGVYDKYSLI